VVLVEGVSVLLHVKRIGKLSGRRGMSRVISQGGGYVKREMSGSHLTKAVTLVACRCPWPLRSDSTMRQEDYPVSAGVVDDDASSVALMHVAQQRYINGKSRVIG